MLSHKNAPVFFAALLTFGFIELSAQSVGINTTTPRTTLEVAGDTQVTGTIEISNYDSLKDGESSTFLVQEGDGSVKSLNVSNPTGVALAYIQEYVIEECNLDWIKEFDTGINSSEYVVIVTSASFDQELDLSNNPGIEGNFSFPYAAAYIQNGTWHLVADYPQAANLDKSVDGTWIIKTLIFSNDVSKQFGSITIPMSNGTTGSATSPIID